MRQAAHSTRIRASRRSRLAASAWLLALAALTSAAVALAGEPATNPLPAGKKPPGWIEIEKVSNGCGGGALIGVQNWVGDTATYSTGNPFEPAIKVSFREACNFHDAAYSGALVWDSVHNRFTDFRDMSREQADLKMHDDMNLACDSQIPAKYPKLREECRAGVKHWLLVRLTGGLIYRDRTDLGGNWANLDPGWPLCDIGAHRWQATQTGREVTITWQHGTAGATGSFKGVLITGDRVADDRVVGEYTITDGGKRTGGGAMTLAMTGEDSFDFNGGNVGGKMARKGRETQSAAARHVCRRPPAATTTTTAKPPAAHGTFVLVSNKVVNNNPKELTVDAAGGTARLDHCCDGGHWKLDCNWKVPQTMVAGKTVSLTMSIRIYDMKPEQPNLVAMGARLPDFAEQLSAHYPDNPSTSKTYTPLFHDSQRDAKESFVIINCDNAEITYLYRNSG